VRKPWGKLPTWRRRASVLLGEQPERVRNARTARRAPPPPPWPASVVVATRSCSQEAPSSLAAVDLVLGLVPSTSRRAAASHRSPYSALTGSPRQEAHVRDQQHTGIERLGVVLRERLDAGEAALHTSSWMPVAQPAPVRQEVCASDAFIDSSVRRTNAIDPTQA